MLAVPTGGACDRDVQQCASTGDWCRDGTCVSRSPLGGACSINGGCAERECRRGPAAAGRGRPRRAVRGSAVGVACDAATATWWKRLTCGADGTCGSGVSATTGGALGTTHDGCARSRAAGPPVGGRRSACRVRPSRCKSVVGGGATCVGKWQRRADGCRCDLDCATSDRPCRRWVPVGGVWRGPACRAGRTSPLSAAGACAQRRAWRARCARRPMTVATAMRAPSAASTTRRAPRTASGRCAAAAAALTRRTAAPTASGARGTRTGSPAASIGSLPPARRGRRRGTAAGGGCRGKWGCA